MLDEKTDVSIYCCFILSSFGSLTENTLGQIVLASAPTVYFELMSNIGFMIGKGLISADKNQKNGENIYSLLDEGKKIAKDMSSLLGITLRENTLRIGTELLAKNERERSIKCDIIPDRKRERYDLHIKFMNELNGETILEMKLYAPDEKKAKEMQERFLANPAVIITRTLNMFLKDDYIFFDKGIF